MGLNVGLPGVVGFHEERMKGQAQPTFFANPEGSFDGVIFWVVF